MKMRTVLSENAHAKHSNNGILKVYIDYFSALLATMLLRRTVHHTTV
jgi:hypothetical protein